MRLIPTDRPILVTGTAGFIGCHVAMRLLESGHDVIGVDNLDPYYDRRLKEARLGELAARPRYRHHHLDIADQPAFSRLVSDARPEFVVHLAAQPGVRYSLEHPHAYAHSNLTAFLNVLEACRHSQVAHLVYASSSSVYGENPKLPFAVGDPVDFPISLYAATKRSNELMAHCYAHLFQIPTTGLRFFTVYGPWGRPDMMIYGFAKKIVTGEPVEIYNHGVMRRDFTYIDDIVEGVVRTLAAPPRQGTTAGTAAPYALYNIGNNRPEQLLHVVGLLERELGREAVRIMRPMQPGDVPATWADVDALRSAVGFEPATPIETGIARFAAWFRIFHADLFTAET